MSATISAQAGDERAEYRDKSAQREAPHKQAPAPEDALASGMERANATNEIRPTTGGEHSGEPLELKGGAPAASNDSEQMNSHQGAPNELQEMLDRPLAENEPSLARARTRTRARTDEEKAANELSLALAAPLSQENGTMPVEGQLKVKSLKPSQARRQQDFDDELEDDELEDRIETLGELNEREAADERLKSGAPLPASDAGNDQLVDFDSTLASLQELADEAGDSNIKRRAALMSSFAGGASSDLGELVAAPGALGELRRLRLSGLKRVQQALRQNKRKRRRRRRRRQKQPPGAADNANRQAAAAAAASQAVSQQEKRDNASLSMALIKSMQTRQGLMAGANAGLQQQQQQQQQQSSLGPMLKQLAAANPLKQQLASGSLQLSTAIQRLLANKFGASAPANHANSNQTLRFNGAKLALHSNNHLAEESEGGDFSATSVGAGGEQLASLLAAGQRQQQEADFALANDMQTHHNHHRRPLSPTSFVGGGGADFEPSNQQLAGDYQGDASSTADRLAELMSAQHWPPAAGAQQQPPPPQQPQVDGLGQAQQQQQQQQEDALKLSQLVAAATAAAAAASGPPTQGDASSAATGAASKQLIPIEIIGLDPSVTSSILYGRQQQQQQRRPLRGQRQRPAGDELPGGQPTAASELDVQENPQQATAPAETQGEAGDEQAASQEGATGDGKTGAVGLKGPSSVLHIHHFHHTQPAGSTGSEQQATSPAQSSQAGESTSEQESGGGGGSEQQSGASTSESGALKETGGEEALAGGNGHQQRAARVSKLLRAQAAGESPPLVLAGGAQEAGEEEAAGPQNWPPSGEGGEPAAEQQALESGESEELGDQSANSKRMRFVTRNSLRNKQQQQQQQQQSRPLFAPHRNHSYAGGYAQEAAGRYHPAHSSGQLQPPFRVQRPLGMRDQQAALHYQRQRAEFYANQTSFNDRLAAPSNELLAAGPLPEPSTDPHQALNDAPPIDGQNMLMVAYRPASLLASQLQQQHADRLQLAAVNRTYSQPPPLASNYAASGHHNTYTRQTPYVGAEPARQALDSQQQRPLNSSSSSSMILRPAAQFGAAPSGKQGPSANLLRSLLKQPKMNQALLLAQLQAAGNQTSSPYWSSDDERLLAQFNLANASAGSLRAAPNNLTAPASSNYPQQPPLLDHHLALLRQLNQTANPINTQLLGANFESIALGGNSSAAAAARDELALALQDQAIKQQLQQQQQQQLKQQQQVASLLLNNLGASSNPLLNMKLAGLANGTSASSGDSLTFGGKSPGRFELTSASDRLPSKFPALRNASSVLAPGGVGGANVRLTSKHFHVPNTRPHEREAAPGRPVDSLDQVLQLATTQPPAHSLKASTAATSQPQAGTSNRQAAGPAAAAPTTQQGADQDGSMLDPAQSLGTLALGFLFFISLASFVLILSSFLYRRRRRAIGSARCGPAARSMGDLDGASGAGGTGGGGHSASGAVAGGLEGRKSSRCFNNLTQRTKHLMRANFTSGSSSTSNVIAGSTPSSSLKSLHQLDSSLTSNGQSHAKSGHQHHHQHDNRALLGKGKQMSCSPTPPAGGGSSKKLAIASRTFDSPNKTRQVWSPDGGGPNQSSYSQSKYTCAISNSASNANAKMSTFNVSGGQQNTAEKHSAPDEIQADRMLPLHPNSDIRTLNTRLQKAAYLQKALGHAPAMAQDNPAPGRSLGAPAAPNQNSKYSSKKQQQQYNRASPASIEMANGQAKYVNTPLQLNHANL